MSEVQRLGEILLAVMRHLLRQHTSKVSAVWRAVMRD